MPDVPRVESRVVHHDVTYRLTDGPGVVVGGWDHAAVLTGEAPRPGVRR